MKNEIFNKIFDSKNENLMIIFFSLPFFLSIFTFCEINIISIISLVSILTFFTIKVVEYFNLKEKIKFLKEIDKYF